MMTAILALTLIAAPAVNAAAVDWDAATTITTRNLDGSTNLWNQADLLEALGIINRKYHRDMQTPAGRKAWHGDVLSVEIDKDAEIRVEIYEDGFAVTNKWKSPTPKIQEEINRAVKFARARASGMPPDVARIYVERSAAEKDTAAKTVTVDVATGKEVEP